MRETARPGMLIVLSGPSGVGKDAAIQGLKRSSPDLYYVVTATTRARRKGEVDGVDYFFLTRDEFERRIAADALLEWSWVHGNLYGPPIAPVQEKLADGRDVLLKIDVQGAENVRRRSQDAIFIFLAPPSIDDLVERLRSRATESSDEMEIRIANAYREMNAAAQYDYLVVNRDGELDQAVQAILDIIKVERLRVQPRRSRLL